MAVALRKEFEEQLLDAINREVSTQIIEAVADDLCGPRPDEDYKSVGSALVKRMAPEAAAKLVLHLVEYFIDRGLIIYSHEDGNLHEDCGGTTVELDGDSQ